MNSIQHGQTDQITHPASGKLKNRRRSDPISSRIANLGARKNKKAQTLVWALLCSGGTDGTRTRDPLRDRQVF